MTSKDIASRVYRYMLTKYQFVPPTTSRHVNTIRYRQITILLIRRLIPAESYPSIAKILGYKSHVGPLEAHRRATEREVTCKHFAKEVKDIESHLRVLNDLSKPVNKLVDLDVTQPFIHGI